MSSFDATLRTLLVTGQGAQPGMLDIALQLRSHQVTASDSAETACLRFRSQPFALVILDYTVNRPQARNICRSIRAAPGGRQSFILMVSPRAAPGELEAVLETGADDYVLKQASVAEICVRLAVAERLIARRASRFSSPCVLRAGNEPANDVAAETAGGPHQLRGERVLTIDGQGLSAWLIHEYAVSRRMRDNSVSSGESALWELRSAFARGDPYRFLIIAAPLPDMKIEQLSAKLRTHPDLRNTLALVLSQPGGEQMRLLSLEPPIVGCLNYPFSPAHLMSAMIAVQETWGQPAQVGHASITAQAQDPARGAPFHACREVQQ